MSFISADFDTLMKHPCARAFAANRGLTHVSRTAAAVRRACAKLIFGRDAKLLLGRGAKLVHAMNLSKLGEPSAAIDEAVGLLSPFTERCEAWRNNLGKYWLVCHRPTGTFDAKIAEWRERYRSCGLRIELADVKSWLTPNAEVITVTRWRWHY